MTPYLVLAGILVVAIVAVRIARRRRRRARLAWLESYAFPAGIRQRVRKRYPHLTDKDGDLVLATLRDYFHLCRKAGRRMLAMPSQVVDVAWHEFILFTRDYQDFCTEAFGHYLHHTPTEAMQTPTQASEALRRTWRLACRQSGMNPQAAAALPPLFAIDAQLEIADGFRYVLDCMKAREGEAAAVAAYCGTHIGCAAGCAAGCAGFGCASGGCGGGDGGGCGGGGGGD